jgi:hypothetical protein
VGDPLGVHPQVLAVRLEPTRDRGPGLGHGPQVRLPPVPVRPGVRRVRVRRAGGGVRVVRGRLVRTRARHRPTEHVGPASGAHGGGATPLLRREDPVHGEHHLPDPATAVGEQVHDLRQLGGEVGGARQVVDLRDRGRGVQRVLGGGGEDLDLVVERPEQRALGDPGGQGDLPRGHLRAVLLEQRHGGDRDGGPPVLPAHRPRAPTAPPLTHAAHCK